MLGLLNPPPVKQSSTNAKTHTFNMNLKQETNGCNESKNSRADVLHNSVIMLTWHRLLKQCDSSRFRITKSQQYDITSQPISATGCISSLFSIGFKALPMTDLNEKDFTHGRETFSCLTPLANFILLQSCLSVFTFRWAKYTGHCQDTVGQLVGVSIKQSGPHVFLTSWPKPTLTTFNSCSWL